MNDAEFYLKFTEGFHDEEPRHCWRIKELGFGVPADGLLVKVEPPCSGRRYGLSDSDIHFLLVSPKYQGDSLFPVSEWPLDVCVFLPMVTDSDTREVLSLHEVKKIALGEIYRDGNLRTKSSRPRLINPW